MNSPFRHAIVFQTPVNVPPTVIVDNNQGYITYYPFSRGYQSTTLKFSNIHEAMGFNFYCNNESIGVCIFKEGVMISITDMSMSEFFTVTVDESEVSIVSVVQISSDTIYVAAIMNIGDGKVVFSSKTIAFKGLCLSISTLIEHHTTTAGESEKHRGMFDLDGSHTGVMPESEDDDIVTYENYSGSHGFGDIKIKEVETGVGVPDSMIKVFDEIVEDLKGFNEYFSDFTTGSIFAIESFEAKNSLFIIALEKEKIHILTVIDDTKEDYQSLDFKKEAKQTLFTNVYSKYMSYYPPRSNTREYKKVFSPAGIIKRYKAPERIVISRVEDVIVDDETVKGIGTYEIYIETEEETVGEGEEEETITKTLINFEELTEEDGKIHPSGGETEFDVSNYDDLMYTFYSGARQVNAHIGDSNVAAMNMEIIHEATLAGELINQKVDIISVKSMSNFMSYGDMTEQGD